MICFLKLCDFPDAFYTTLPSAIYHLLREIIFMKPSIDFSQKQIFPSYVHNISLCLTALTNPSPSRGKEAWPISCQKSRWPSNITFIFGLYRVGVFFWMLLGLSFFGTLISMMSRGLNDLIRLMRPSSDEPRYQKDVF